MIRLSVSLLAAALALPANASELLIRNAEVHTLDRAGTLAHADVRIVDGRIAAVGSGLAPGNAQVVDAGGRALTPGLFAGLTGLGVEEIGAEMSTVDRGLNSEAAAPTIPTELRPEFDIRTAFNPDSAVIGVNRVEGFSFTLVTPTSLPGGSIFAGVGGIARLDGRADAFVAGDRDLLVDLGSDTAVLTGNSRAAQYMLVEQAIREANPDARMRDADFRLLTPNGRDVLAQYLGAGRVVFQVDRAADIRQVLALARRHRMHAVIAGGVEAWRVAKELAAAKVPVVLDPLIDLPGSFDQLGATLENAARLQAAGVQIAFTRVDDPTHNARKLRQAAGNAVAHGLDHDAALAALTRNPADIFGVGDQLGRIAPGYRADLVLWSGDPLEVTSVAERMWLDGNEQSMRSRQTELRDRYRPKSAPAR